MPTEAAEAYRATGQGDGRIWLKATENCAAFSSIVGVQDGWKTPLICWDMRWKFCVVNANGVQFSGPGASTSDPEGGVHRAFHPLSPRKCPSPRNRFRHRPGPSADTSACVQACWFRACTTAPQGQACPSFMAAAISLRTTALPSESRRSMRFRPSSEGWAGFTSSVPSAVSTNT